MPYVRFTVVVPLPDVLTIESPPVPLMAPAILEIASAGCASVSVFAPSVTVPAGKLLAVSPLIVTPEVAPPMFRTLVLADKEMEVLGSDAVPERNKVFALGTVKVPLQALGAVRVKLPEPVQVNAPVAVFVPESVKLPEPSMVIAPAPEMAPLSVKAFDLEVLKVPSTRISPAIEPVVPPAPSVSAPPVGMVVKPV